jgi:hypothetical protein
VLIFFLLDHLFPQLMCPHPLDPPPLVGCESWRIATRCWCYPGAGWSSKSSSILNLSKPDGVVWETKLSSLVAAMNWPLPQHRLLPSHLGPCSAPLQPPLDLSLFCALVIIGRCLTPQPCLTLAAPLIHQQKTPLWATIACAMDQWLLLPLGKPDGPV